MRREKCERLKPRGESTNAEHWGGPTRTSDEGPVMGLEQRGRVRRLHERNNWKQEDLDACDRQTNRSISRSAGCTKRIKRSDPMERRLVWMVRRSSSSRPTWRETYTRSGTG